MTERRGPQSSGVLVELALYAVSALISFALLNNVLKKLDPNQQNNKQASAKRKEIASRLGRPVLETNQYEDIIACDVINPDHINVKFETIGGLEDIKKALYDLVILPLVRPELFERGRLLKPTKGVLLYGPPGTGKTMLAKALAKESNACFINVRAAALQSKWFGDAQKLVTAVFTLAWKIQPCIIFIDEIDSFLGTRKSNEHEAVTSMKTEFMSLWDGFITDNDARVMVLAATNRPWDIDEAILRRLPRAFEVPLPDARQRHRILSVLMRGEDVDETLWADEEEEGEEGDAAEHGLGGGSVLSEVAAATEGYSGSDLQDLCKQAALLPIHDLLEEEAAASASGRPMRRDAPRPLTAEDLFTVLESAPPPSAEAAAAYQRSVNVTRAARASGAGAGGVDLTQLLAAMMSGGAPAPSPGPGAGTPGGRGSTPGGRGAGAGGGRGPRLPPRSGGPKPRRAGSNDAEDSWHDASE